MINVMLQSNGMDNQIHCPQKVLHMYWVTSVTSEDLSAICAHATAHIFLLAGMADTSSKWRDGREVQALKTSSWREQSTSHSGGTRKRSQKLILCLWGLPHFARGSQCNRERPGARWSRAMKPQQLLACVSHELLAPAPDGLAVPARDAANTMGDSWSIDCHIHHECQAVVFSLSLKQSVKSETSLRKIWLLHDI